MKMRKVVSILLVAAMTIGMVTGCGSSSDKKTAKSDAKGKVYYLNFKPEADEQWQELAEQYTDETGVPVTVLTAASGEYEKTLITPNSDFDRYLKGDKTALTEQQVRGYELFKQHKCDTCHTGVAMGGQSYEYMGLYGDYFKDRGTPLTDADEGRFAQTKDPFDMHRFKVPTLRNIALTAPYFHDASAKELKDAVSAMLKYQSNVKQPAQKDVEDITSFLESLTGEFKGEKLKYVSRGGLKLEKALQVFEISVDGQTTIDIGASTGGFTDVMLQRYLL